LGLRHKINVILLVLNQKGKERKGAWIQQAVVGRWKSTKKGGKKPKSHKFEREKGTVVKLKLHFL
jgi:hypothetical protein